MGAPKQKWSSEEEAALTAGVLKHGPGKWRMILKDPDFGGVLHQRSNVDLKDKWRNMLCLENGLGSREKGRLALKKMHQIPRQDESLLALANVAQSDEDTSEAKPVATSIDSQQIGSSRKSMIRLDNAIMEAINNLNEPGGSKKPAIIAYIEDQYFTPPSFKGIVFAKLNYLTATGKLVKENQKYRIATTLTFPERRNSSISLLEGRQELSPELYCDDTFILAKSQIDSELAMMWSMTPAEAAAVAAQAVADAEAAITEAEEAEREAEEAEAYLAILLFRISKEDVQ